LPRETHRSQTFGGGLQGWQGPARGAAHLRSSAAHISSASNSSSVILVTVPAPTGAGAFAAERYSEARGRPWDSQPRPSRFTASRQRLVTGASEPRYRRTSRASSNHTQGLITWPLSTSLPIACQPGRRLRAKISRYGAGHSRSMPSFASSGFWLCWRRGAMISSRTSRRNRWTPLPGCSWPVGSWAAELTTFV